MQKKSPYDVILSRHVTEKARVLEQLQTNSSSATLKRFDKPKHVFVVDKCANKKEIAAALEEIYRERKIKVLSVNTINAKPKAKRMRGRAGIKAGFKKAIVTLEAGDTIEASV